MTFDPDRTEVEALGLIEDKLNELLIQLKRVARLLEILTDTEVTPEDVEE